MQEPQSVPYAIYKGDVSGPAPAFRVESHEKSNSWRDVMLLLSYAES